MRAEPALRFWLDFVEAEGGVAEDGADSDLVLLPEHLRSELDLPEELSVTDDPDVARQEDALLVIAGQPVLVQAAEVVLARGDVGWARLPWPESTPPSREALQDAARSQVMVDHGRIDIDGQPARRYLPALRVGALVEYHVSLEDRFGEQAEVWVDARSGEALPAAVVAALGRSATLPGPGRDHACLPPDPAHALAGAHALLEARAGERRAQLSRQSGSARDAEVERVGAYYEAALASIVKRRQAAPPDRWPVYDAQAETTRAERARRLHETRQKFAGRHEIRPFRLHLIGIPGVEVPIVVRRGSRAFGLTLDWYLPFATWAPITCPHCGSGDVLVAGRDRLGCRTCLHRPAQLPDPSPPAEAPGGAPRPPPAPERDAPQPPAPAVDQARPTESAPAPARPGAGTARRTKASASVARRVPKIGNELGQSFWKTVVLGQRWSATAPRSPADVLGRLYGTEGPLYAVGFPPDACATGVDMQTRPGDIDGIHATSGSLLASGRAFAYTLRWKLVAKSPVVVEILPFSDVVGSTLPSLARLSHLADARLRQGLPQPAGLGPVEQRLWAHVSSDGLPLVVRCLALWWRIQGNRRLDGIDTSALVAAVAVTARRRSGVHTSIAKMAGSHDVQAATVKQACETIEAVLGAAVSQLW
jgi:hypothetical protein